MTTSEKLAAAVIPLLFFGFFAWVLYDARKQAIKARDAKRAADEKMLYEQRHALAQVLPATPPKIRRSMYVKRPPRPEPSTGRGIGREMVRTSAILQLQQDSANNDDY